MLIQNPCAVKLTGCHSMKFGIKPSIVVGGGLMPPRLANSLSGYFAEVVHVLGLFRLRSISHCIVLPLF